MTLRQTNKTQKAAANPSSSAELAAEPPIAPLSEKDAKALALRAKDRRCRLGLSRQALSALLGVTHSTFLKWEYRLPLHTDNDALWEAAISVPEGWLRDPGMPAQEAILVTEQEATTVADEIRGICRWLSRKHLPYRTALTAELSLNEQRSADMLALRYGVEGEAAALLEQIAKRYGVTRSRIQQITRTMAFRAEGLSFKTPRIDALFGALPPLLPASVEEIDQLLAAQLGESLSIAGVGRFMREILRRPGVTIRKTTRA